MKTQLINAAILTYFINYDIFDASFTPRFVVVNFNENMNKQTGLYLEPVLTGKIGSN